MKKIIVLLGVAVVLFSCIEDAELRTKDGNGVKKSNGKFKKYEPKDSTATDTDQQAVMQSSFELKK